MERGTLAVLYGPPGAAKTFVAIDMALSVSTGREFAGRRTAQGLVVYVGGEGQRSFGRRLKAWRIGRSVDAIGTNFAYITERVGLRDEANVELLADTIDAYSKALGERVESVFFDTWQRHLEGDENSTTDVSRACRNLCALVRDRFDCSIAVLHHTGWSESDRIRGARVLEGECDSLWQVSLDNERNVTTVSCKRMRDGKMPGPLVFRGRLVQVNEAGHESWCVEYAPGEKPQNSAEAGLGDKERRTLETVRRLYAGERERMLATGSNPMIAEVTTEMLRSDLVTRGVYPGDEGSNRAISNVLSRLLGKRLIERRGRRNFVPV